MNVENSKSFDASAFAAFADNEWAAYAGCPLSSGNLRKIASYIGVGEMEEVNKNNKLNHMRKPPIHYIALGMCVWF